MRVYLDPLPGNSAPDGDFSWAFDNGVPLLELRLPLYPVTSWHLPFEFTMGELPEPYFRAFKFSKDRSRPELLVYEER